MHNHVRQPFAEIIYYTHIYQKVYTFDMHVVGDPHALVVDCVKDFCVARFLHIGTIEGTTLAVLCATLAKINLESILS